MRHVRVTVRCSSCGFRAAEDALDLLRTAGMLKRAGDDVDEYLIEALLGAAAPKLQCPECSHSGLLCEQLDDQEDDDWPGEKSCKQCGKGIPVERLRLFPHNEYCAACQQQRESGAVKDDHRDFCPWCGQVLSHKTTRRRGVTEYVPACPACGYVG